MSRNGCSDTERAQCVTRYLEGHGTNSVQELFLNRYNRTPPARSHVWHWREEYQSRGYHAHRGGNRRTKISEWKKVDYNLQENLRGIVYRSISGTIDGLKKKSTTIQAVSEDTLYRV